MGEEKKSCELFERVVQRLAGLSHTEGPGDKAVQSDCFFFFFVVVVVVCFLQGGGGYHLWSVFLHLSKIWSQNV